MPALLYRNGDGRNARAGCSVSNAFISVIRRQCVTVLPRGVVARFYDPLSDPTFEGCLSISHVRLKSLLSIFLN
jgi:hypothetical protein